MTQSIKSWLLWLKVVLQEALAWQHKQAFLMALLTAMILFSALRRGRFPNKEEVYTLIKAFAGSAVALFLALWICVTPDSALGGFGIIIGFMAVAYFFESFKQLVEILEILWRKEEIPTVNPTEGENSGHYHGDSRVNTEQARWLERLEPVDAKDLLSRLVSSLRPIVYADGRCECCTHDDEQVMAIGNMVLQWWKDHHIDMDDETFEAMKNKFDSMKGTEVPGSSS